MLHITALQRQDSKFTHTFLKGNTRQSLRLRQTTVVSRVGLISALVTVPSLCLTAQSLIGTFDRTVCDLPYCSPKCYQKYGKSKLKAILHLCEFRSSSFELLHFLSPFKYKVIQYLIGKLSDMVNMSQES